MESVCDKNDKRPAAGAYQDENGTWLRQERWYEDKITHHFHNCYHKRISLDEGHFYQMALYYARVLK